MVFVFMGLDVSRNEQREGRTFAVAALSGYFPAEQFDDMFRNCQAQTRTAVRSGYACAVDLGERLEDSFEFIGCYACSGIFDVESDITFVVKIFSGDFDFDEAFLRESYCVSDEV